MTQTELLRLVRMEDLQGADRDMAELIGLEAYLRLAEVYGGTTPYIALPGSISIPARNRVINEEYDGTNAAEIARRWGISERHVREITKAKAAEIVRRPIDGQITMY